MKSSTPPTLIIFTPIYGEDLSKVGWKEYAIDLKKRTGIDLLRDNAFPKTTQTTLDDSRFIGEKE